MTFNYGTSTTLNSTEFVKCANMHSSSLSVAEIRR